MCVKISIETSGKKPTKDQGRHSVPGGGSFCFVNSLNEKLTVTIHSIPVTGISMVIQVPACEGKPIDSPVATLPTGALDNQSFIYDIAPYKKLTGGSDYGDVGGAASGSIIVVDDA